MICPNCGEEISSDSIFCNYCGNKIEKEEGIQEGELEPILAKGLETEKRSAKGNKVIKVVLIVVLLGIMGFLTISMQKNISNETIMSEFKGFFQEGEYEKAYDLYQSEMQEDKVLLEKTSEYLLSQINSIEKNYGEKILSYEAAVEELDQVAAYGMLEKQVMESRNNLIALNKEEINAGGKQVNSGTKQPAEDEFKGELEKPVLEVISVKVKSSLVFNDCYVQVKNVSEQSIEKYELIMLYFDKDGKVANDASTGSNIGKGKSDAKLYPEQTSNTNRYHCIPGNAEKVKAIVSRAEFFDGSVWCLEDLDEWIAREKDRF